MYFVTSILYIYVLISFVPSISAARIKEGMSVDELPLEENVNQLVTEGDEARTMDEAISVLRLVNCCNF